MKKRFLFFFVATALAFAMLLPVFGGCGPQVVSVKVSAKPTKIDYVAGETLDLTGMAVTGKLENDAERELSADEYTVTPAAGTALKESDMTVTVTYGEGEGALKATFAIKVHNRVKSLALKTPPTKTAYWAGEEKFDPAGMVLTATREDKSTEDVTVKGNSKVTVEDKTLATAGDADETQKIKVTFDGVSYEQEITVKANPVTALTVKTEQTKQEYFAGEKFDPAGLVLTATYKSGKVVEVKGTDAGVTYPNKALTAADASETITFGGKTVTVSFTVVDGLFIEAELGIINSSSVAFNTNALVDVDGDGEKENTATGGMYVGNMKAGDTVDFDFKASKAGTIKMAFRMASQYLKEDSNWTPIWMGDCQFNKICKVYVNGVEYNIPDTMVLPGGGKPAEEGGEPDGSLWYNWQEVEFPSLKVIEGRNVVRLEFIKHDYVDCSQASFKGAFTANLDSLKLLPGDSGIKFEGYYYAAAIDNEFVSYEEKPEDQEGGDFKLGEDGYYVIAESKSAYENHRSFWAKEAAHKGGKADGFNGWGSINNDGDYVEYSFYLSGDGKADIDWLCASSYWSEAIGGNQPTEDLGAVARLTVNGRAIDVDSLSYPIGSPQDWTNYQHTLVKGIDLVKGRNTVRMTRTGKHGMNHSRLEVFAEKSFASLESLSVDASEAVTEYAIGRKFTTKGLKATAMLTGGVTVDVPAAALTFEDKVLTAADTTVTVSYTMEGVTKTADVAVTVTEDGPAVGLFVAKLPTKLDYAEGETFDPAGMEVSRCYVSGKHEPVTDFTATMTDGVVTVVNGGLSTSFTLANAAAPAANYVSGNIFDPAKWDTANEPYVKPVLENGDIEIAPNTASRLSLLNVNGNNIVHNNTTVADGTAGTFTMDVKADGAFGFMLFATASVKPTDTKAFRAIFVDYADGVFTIRASGDSDGRVLATAFTDFSETDFNRIDLVVTRVDKETCRIDLSVNGKHLVFADAPGANFGAVVDNGFTFKPNGYGPRMNFVTGENTTMYLSAPDAA